MKKNDLIQVVNDMTVEQEISFIEQLDNGFKNTRLMSCSKEAVIVILNDFFDDDLYGHVRDFNYTTILDYTIN